VNVYLSLQRYIDKLLIHSIVVANEGQRIDLPDGVVLENRECLALRSIKR
jgi:hypothetical protein